MQIAEGRDGSSGRMKTARRRGAPQQLRASFARDLEEEARATGGRGLACKAGQSTISDRDNGAVPECSVGTSRPVQGTDYPNPARSSSRRAPDRLPSIAATAQRDAQMKVWSDQSEAAMIRLAGSVAEID